MRECIGGFNVANIARMPQLVDIFEEVEELRDESAMCVGKDADFYHDYFNLNVSPTDSTSLNCTFDPSIL